MKKELLKFKHDVEKLLKEKTSLLEISNISYERFVRGEKVPRLTISKTHRGAVIRLDAIYDVSQRWLTPLTENVKAKDSTYSRFSFWVKRNEVHFIERKVSGSRIKEVEITEENVLQ